MSSISTPPVRPETFALGYAKTLPNLSGLRSHSSSYENTTGRPFALYIKVVGGTETALNIKFSHDGVAWQDAELLSDVDSTRISAHAIIPPGFYYKTSGGTIETWLEVE